MGTKRKRSSTANSNEPPTPPLARPRRHPPPLPTVEDWRHEIIIEALVAIAADREYAEGVARGDSDSSSRPETVQPDGLPSGESPFVFNNNYDPESLQPSEAVQQRWREYKTAHPDCSERDDAFELNHGGLEKDHTGHSPRPQSAEPSSHPDESSPPGKKKHRSAAKKEYDRKRKRDRRQRAGKQNAAGFGVSNCARILRNIETRLHPNIKHSTLATNNTPFVGPPPCSKDKIAYLQRHDWKSDYADLDLPKSVRALLEDGYDIVVNDSERAQIFTDADGKIIGVKVMPMKGVRWSFVVDSVEQQLALLYDSLGERAAAVEHGTCRTNGLFRHITAGLSMGGGQSRPRYLNVRNEYHEPLRAFVEHPDVRLFAHHMGRAFKFWFPDLHAVCTELVTDVRVGLGDDFGPAYPDLPFFIETANTGKQVVTPMHVDFKNALFGMCIISVFGCFDHQKHGMLILKELKLIVQLKHGDVIFIPSALLTHGNTELGPDDVRRSWTLFNSGGLFRYRDTGFRTQKSLDADEARDVERMYPLFFEKYMSSHLTLDELKRRHDVL